MLSSDAGNLGVIRTSRVSHRVPIGRGVVKLGLFDLLGQGIGELLGVQLVGEGWESTQADVQHDAKGPDINGLCVFPVSAIGQDFRCHVAGGATERCREGFLADDLGQPEIGEFYVQVLIDQEDILGFDVPMNNVPIVLRHC